MELATPASNSEENSKARERLKGPCRGLFFFCGIKTASAIEEQESCHI